MSLDIFSSSMRSVLALLKSTALGRHWRLTDRAGGADIVLVAIVFSLTEVSSALLIAARGWWCVTGGCGGGGGGTLSGGGGGGRASAPSSRLQGAVIVLKYSDGLMSLSGALFGNAGGMNGRAGCLLTRLGQRGRSSSAGAVDVLPAGRTAR